MLLEMKPDINLLILNQGFYWACNCGILDICKYLLEVRPEIDISHDNDEPFKTACRFGKYNIVKFLLELKPTINIMENGDKLFQMGCNNEDIELIRFLQKSIPNKYHIYVLNGKIKDKSIFEKK